MAGQMKILHITPHLGGGIGTVIMDWMDKEPDENSPIIMSLDYANKKAISRLENSVTMLLENCAFAKDKTIINQYISSADIVLIHYWDHPMLADLFADPIPDCRMVFWCHKNFGISVEEVLYPDFFVATSSIINDNIVDKTGKFATTKELLVDKMLEQHCRTIWSTGNMARFLAIEPKPRKGFNIGYAGTVDYKKLHPNFLAMCLEIMKHIPDVHFTVIGEQNIGITEGHDDRFTFTGKVDDVVPYLAEMDVFGYPLRPDGYGTCEIALGEAMAAGVVPVVMDNLAEKSIVLPNINGCVVSNEKEYIEAIRYLYDDPIDKEAFSASCRHRARKLYSIDTMIQQWDRVFNDLMKIPKRKRGIL